MKGVDPAMRTGNRRGVGRSTVRIDDTGTRNARVSVARELYESLREFTLINFLIVNINSWTVDVRVADGVKGAGHGYAAEEKAELVSLAMEYGILR